MIRFDHEIALTDDMYLAFFAKDVESLLRTYGATATIWRDEADAPMLEWTVKGVTFVATNSDAGLIGQGEGWTITGKDDESLIHDGKYGEVLSEVFAEMVIFNGLDV